MRRAAMIIDMVATIIMIVLAIDMAFDGVVSKAVARWWNARPEPVGAPDPVFGVAREAEAILRKESDASGG